MLCPILYHDSDLVVCVKPRGISSENNLPGLLAGQLAVRKVWCVHRLDTAVGGVMVYALNEKAASKLSSMIAAHDIKKEYIAVADGHPTEAEGIMKDLLYHDQVRNKSYPVNRVRAGVKEAELTYTVLETQGTFSLLRVRLKTGRSHQIRVQFASRGMPLLGDVKYGSGYRNCPIALWSHALHFTHPFTTKFLSFSALPESSFPWDCFETIHTEGQHEIS